ncbi:MAG: glycine zipper 2TM domain-containing protein [Pelomonas sp.]|nr:glycine zipper 2TM domain-containing protein [Roseateles sp.]
MSAFPFKSTQIVAGVAVVVALLGGAYAIGRSEGTGSVPEQTQASAAQPSNSQSSTNNKTPVAGSLTSAAAVASADTNNPPENQAPLCSSCARVTDVHTEARQAQTSGVGAVGGAVVGGVLGSMLGGGTGKKLATVGGAVAGGFAGNEIEKDHKTYTVWVVQVQERDGRTRRFVRNADPGLRVGDEVRLTDGGFARV